MHKKEEEALLNKKKKREEIKQKNKTEKNKLNNMNYSNQYNFYPGMYMPQIPQMQINNQNPAYFNEYQNFYYLNPSQAYQINPQMFPPFMQQSFMMQPKSLEESLNMIYSRGIVNHLIGAFFIKECQERQNRKVPISTVELKDEQGENNDNNNNEENNNNANNLDKGENDLDKKDKDNVDGKNEEMQKEKKEENKEEEEKKENENELKMPSMV